jgi:hypothetical protein
MLLPERQQFNHHLAACADCHTRFLGALKIANQLHDRQDQQLRRLTQQVRDLEFNHTNYLEHRKQSQRLLDKLSGRLQQAQASIDQHHQQARQFQSTLTQLQGLISRQQQQLEQFHHQLENLIRYQVNSLFRQPPAASSPSRRLNPNWILPTASQSEQPTRPDLASLKPEPTEQAQLLPKESNSMTAITLNPTILLATNDREASITATTKAKPPSRAFLKVAAAVLLGTLILAPLAYYQLPHRSPASNAAIIVDSPDITVEDVERNLLTEEAIKEIEQLVKNRETDKAQLLLRTAIKQAYSQNDQLAKARLLYLQGRVFSQKGDLFGAIAVLKQSIGAAQSLNQPTLLLGPTSLLANLYHFTDQNAAAAEQAQQTLSLARTTNQPLHQAFSLQILGLSQFFAYKSSNVEKLLEESIAIARKHQGYDYLVQGYTYLGVIKTERKQFKEATKQFEQALASIKFVSDTRQKAYLEFTVKGYYARSQALANNTDQAIKLYNTAIIRAQESGVQQYLALSQLHYGLAACLTSQGSKVEADKTIGKAELLEQEAHKRCEITNTALSFSIMRKVPKRCN